jgi:hypothetical protein
MTDLRQIDKQIAQRIFGALIVNRGAENDLWEVYPNYSGPLMYYTMDHRAAWYAFETLDKDGTLKLGISICRGNFGPNYWSATIINKYDGFGKTIPEALCKAMLEYVIDNGIQNSPK